MNFFQFLKQRRNLKIIKSVTGEEVKLIKAFNWKGIDYWQVDDVFQMKTGRALCAITFYEEFAMRCDAEYLKKHCRAIDILMSNPKVLKLGEIALLHENLKERVKFAPYPDHIYRLASVLYFDIKEENAFSYDFKYNAEKIKRWKEDPELLAFLVSQPLRALMPFGELVTHNLKTFLEIKELENQEHLKKLDQILLRTP